MAEAQAANTSPGGDLAGSRQWAVKNIGGGLMLAAAVLVTGVTVLTDLRHEPFPAPTRTANYALSALVALFGGYLLRTSRRLPAWLANSIPSAAAILICLPTSAEEAPDELGPLLLTWPVTFAAAVLSARVAWVTVSVAALVFAVLAPFSRGVDGVVLWIEVAASLVAICWMVVRVQHQSLRLRETLSNLARTDPLTGLVNRRGFDEALAREHARSRRGAGPMALLLVDIDHFKRVNDRYGHLAGDDLLAATASTLISHVRAGDVLGRFGGEEFVALLPGAGQEQACWIAERLRERVRASAIPSLGAEATVTVSIGVAALGRDGNELFELLAAADAALYRAKQAGRDRVCTLPLGACPSDPRHRCP